MSISSHFITVANVISGPGATLAKIKFLHRQGSLHFHQTAGKCLDALTHLHSCEHISIVAHYLANLTSMSPMRYALCLYFIFK